VKNLFNPNTKDFQANEFINWQIQNANLGKLDCLKDPFKIPHKQHWIMLESVHGQKLETPIVNEEL
jgi:hypothetical protein